MTKYPSSDKAHTPASTLSIGDLRGFSGEKKVYLTGVDKDGSYSYSLEHSAKLISVPTDVYEKLLQQNHVRKKRILRIYDLLQAAGYNFADDDKRNPPKSPAP